MLEQVVLMSKLLIDRKVFFTFSTLIALLIIYTSMKHIVRSAYDSYWVAIDRVQTVDFNIMALTSLGTVSEIIKAGDASKAQEFVDSNYCLFRIQIKKCSNDECSTQKIVADNALSETARCRALADKDKNALTIPVFENSTSAATVMFDNSYSTTPTVLPRSEIPIGYLNLYRGNVVPFTTDYQNFLSKWLKGQANASRHVIYKTAATVSILFGLMTFMFLFVVRQFYIAHIKRKAITEKLVQLIDLKIHKATR